MTTSTRVRKLALHTTQGTVAVLHRESQFVVRYDEQALARPALAISLTMPPRPDGWRSNQIPPILSMNLPEGFLLHRVIDRYRKVMDIEDMNLLAVTSTPAAGRVWASVPDHEPKVSAAPMALRDILAHPGTEELFDELLEKYAEAPLSGVQPKVAVPEQPPESADGLDRSGRAPDVIDKSSIKSPDLIVKAAGVDYPNLAENEYICMSLARHVGLDTPDFWLSDDRKLFVIRRFDVSADGYLGFEDMAVLTGRHPSRKYEGSCSDVARAIVDFAAPVNRHSSLDAFFRLMVVNCLVRNGDAHLKNFGILYGDPTTADRDARLAPAYDIVSSTVYIPNDVLALGLGGSKAWPDRKRLERFGKEICSLTNPGAIIDELIEKAMGYQYEDPGSSMWKKVETQLRTGADSLRAARKLAPVR